MTCTPSGFVGTRTASRSLQYRSRLLKNQTYSHVQAKRSRTLEGMAFGFVQQMRLRRIHPRSIMPRANRSGIIIRLLRGTGATRRRSWRPTSLLACKILRLMRPLPQPSELRAPPFWPPGLFMNESPRLTKHVPVGLRTRCTSS
ncbi:MAG TPA: hypothetical protein DCQ64_00380 [Candidatus Rokubacteria bacterium]|nr:hypothetical protein [Candidatus Rokubacteria bacterium]